ncbi:MAG: hypothetical protein AAGM67_09225, partial [Bacteroidota bacterium]
FVNPNLLIAWDITGQYSNGILKTLKVPMFGGSDISVDNPQLDIQKPVFGFRMEDGFPYVCHLENGKEVSGVEVQENTTWDITEPSEISFANPQGMVEGWFLLETLGVSDKIKIVEKMRDEWEIISQKLASSEVVNVLQVENLQNLLDEISHYRSYFSTPSELAVFYTKKGKTVRSRLFGTFSELSRRMDRELRKNGYH